MLENIIYLNKNSRFYSKSVNVKPSAKSKSAYIIGRTFCEIMHEYFWGPKGISAPPQIIWGGARPGPQLPRFLRPCGNVHAVMFLDLKKAFETVDHEILLHKLMHME